MSFSQFLAIFCMFRKGCRADRGPLRGSGWTVVALGAEREQPEGRAIGFRLVHFVAVETAQAGLAMMGVRACRVPHPTFLWLGGDFDFFVCDRMSQLSQLLLGS
jgi:hypothetical protein